MRRILCIKLESIEALQAAAARCKQFTPLVGIDPDVFPQSVLLDITRVVHLFGGEAALVQRIASELCAEGWQFRIAVADTPGAAWRWRRTGKKGSRGERAGHPRSESRKKRNLPFSLSPLLPCSPSPLSPWRPSACRSRSSRCCIAWACGGSDSWRPCRGASFPRLRARVAGLPGPRDWPPAASRFRLGPCRRNSRSAGRPSFPPSGEK